MLKCCNVAAVVLGAAMMLGGVGGAGVAPARGAVPLAAADQPDLAKMLAEKAPAYVTVKFILKFEGGGELAGMMGGDQEMEVTGVMIDPKGLVLVNSTEMGGMMSRLMGGEGPKATPSEIKVLVGDDTTGVDAKVIARDSELDLTWVKVEKAPETPYAFVDLTKNATAKVGETVYSISRMGKFFDRAALISELKISGMTKKPRDLFFGSGGGLFGGGAGLPTYNAQGQVIGVTSLILPDAEEMGGMGAGMFGGMRDMMAGAILPAAEVIKATANARDQAAAGGDATAEKADKSAETPADKPAEKK